jgi:hypothetical protein
MNMSGSLDQKNTQCPTKAAAITRMVTKKKDSVI